MTVVGPAGIGKSRLVRELRESAAPQARVLTGSCLPYGEGVAFRPLAEIVREAAGETDARAWIEGLLADDDHAATIAEHVLQVAGLAEAVEAGRDTQWAVRRFFEALAAERPLLAVFEDVHWADTPLLDLIEFLIDTAQAPLLFVCLAREEFAEQRPAWLEAGPRSSAVRLERLSDADTVALIDGLDRDGTLSDDQRAQLVARSEGNPLFVEQMLALVGESEDDAGHRLDPAHDPGAARGPPRPAPDRRAPGDRCGFGGREGVLAGGRRCARAGGRGSAAGRGARDAHAQAAAGSRASGADRRERLRLSSRADP